MRANTRCALLRCAKENSFCVIYMAGVAATLALVTALVFGGALLTFALTFVALSLLGAWYLKACYTHTDDAPPSRRKDEATGEET